MRYLIRQLTPFITASLLLLSTSTTATAGEQLISAETSNATAVDSTTAYTNGDSKANELTVTGPWFNHNVLSLNTSQLVNAIANSAAHGLNPDAYKINQIKNSINRWNSIYAINGVLSIQQNQQRTHLENQLKDSFLLLLADLGQGVLDARSIQRDLKRNVPAIKLVELYELLVNAKASVNELLVQVAPNSKTYQQLTNKMRELLQEHAGNTIRTLINIDESVSPGHSTQNVLALKKRLISTGDLVKSTGLTPVFDQTLSAALSRFQSRHGLPANGRANQETLEAVNVDVKTEIEQVALSLERWRWMPRQLGQLHVYVNLPSYKLEMHNGDQQILDMPVVIGATKHQTPTFTKKIQFVEIQPTWTVPVSILQNEMLPMERRKPGYLKSKGFDFFRWSGGKMIKVAHSSVTRADLYKKTFPYVLRQRSGENNALGQLKILMPNLDAIYLHDTQEKHLFAQNERAHSHGCIRLRDPFRVANLLMQIDGIGRDKTDYLLNQKDTTRVKLTAGIPIHLTYFTTWIDADGILQKRKDIYKHDLALRDALRSSNTLLSVLHNPLISTELFVD